MASNIAILGSGNLLFCDDAAGVYAAAFLEAQYDFDPPVACIDGGAAGLDMWSYLESFSQVWLLNTDSDAPCGTVTVQTAEEFLARVGLRKTANDAVLAELLQAAYLEGVPCDMRIISIAPCDVLSVTINLSSALKMHWPHVIEAIVAVLEDAGIALVKKPYHVTLESIISYKQGVKP